MKKSTLTENKAEQTPTGGVLVGKRQGQTIIHNKGTLSGYLVGKTHAEGGIKAVNKSTGQALEMQGGEVVITAPAVSDNTKREFEGKMLTNREILSKINEKGGGVSFAKGGDVPKSIKHTGASYKYGGKTMTDHDILKHITGGHLAEGMTLSQIAKKHKVSVKELQTQVDLGMKAESEHTSSKREQMKIVKDHLYENPKYYTLLKRAGLKHGGAVRKVSLVRDSKKGNTPARDLNNYNDVIDMDADGVVGAETGLFAKGGKVKTYDDGGSVKETVEYITIGNQSSNPYMDLEKVRFYNFIDFKIFIKDLYANSGATNKREVFLCINRDDSIAKFGVTVSQGRNTNSNFNPFTGTFKDLEKNLQKFSVGNFNLFDWNRWGGVKNATTTTSQTSKQIVPDADSVISIMVLDEDKTTIATANNIDELLDILIQAQKDGVREFKLKYIFKDSSIYQAYYVSWIENTTIDNDIDPYNTSPTELKIWLRKKTDLNKNKFNLTYFFSKSATATPTINVATSGKFSSGEIDMFSKIDYIVYSFDITFVSEVEWGYDPTMTRDFDIVDTLTGDFFKLRKYNLNLGVQEEDVNKEKSKALIKDYNEWKLMQSTGSVTTSATIKLSKKDLKNIKIKINSDLNLAQKVVVILEKYGFTDTGAIRRKIDNNDEFYSIWTGIGSYVGWFEDEDDFNDSNKKEIFASDLGISTATTSATTSTPFNLTKTKIWIGDNTALSKRVQEKAMELGFDWWGGNKIPKNLDFDNLFFDVNEKITSASDRKQFNSFTDFKEITESDLFGNGNTSSIASQTSTLEEEMKGFDFSTLFPSENEDWVKKFTADLDKLLTYLPNNIDFAPELSKEQKDLNALVKLLPSFQQSKYAIERAKILNEIKKLHNKLTYEGFIKPNEAISSDADLFTPQGLLHYYYTQATQNPTAELEPACELITPNGEKSKLPMSAYLNVRTPQFKNWFGDWEKAYETGNYVNCSKMIDPDTKEPKIYFHGVRKYVPNFGQFSNMGQGVVRPYGAFEPPSFPASYFAGEEDYAKFYGGVAENMPTPSTDYKPFIYKTFLSVKNPISLLPLDFMLSYKDFMDYIYVGYGVKVEPNQELLKVLDNDVTKKNPMWIYVRRDIGFIEKLKDYGYDAIFQLGDIPTFLPNGEVEPDRTKHLQEVEYLTFYPNQVKSATVKKSFYFDFFNDIRFKNGGYVRI